MDNDILSKKDEKRKPALGIIIFALLLICNVALFFLFLEIKTKIDEHNRILLTLPPDLQNQIIKIFQHTAKELTKDVTKQTQETSRTIIANTDLSRYI